MRLLNRYIREAVISATGLVVLILMGIEIFMEFIGQLSKIDSTNYGLEQAFFYVLTQLPLNLYQLFPMAGFLGCLIGLGRLASSSQLIVIQAAGVSIARVTGSVLKAASLMIIVVTFIGEFVSPRLESKGALIKSLTLSKAIGYQALGGVWLRDKYSFIHIGSIDSKNKIRNVSRFQFNQHQLLSAAFAPEGSYSRGNWVLYHVKQSLFTPTRIKKIKISHLPLQIVFDPQQLQQSQKTVEEQSIVSLYHKIQYCVQSGLQTNSFVFAFWQRIIQPFTTLVMICLGVPFIFSSLRQASIGLRILTGVIVGFAFYMLNQFFGPFAVVYQLPPVLAALMPTMLFAVACVILLRYSRR
ncbi:LPS export ABC transporter permease LptG [Coxiella endosymbiont of Dermacentor marginatus]|uniref:LPS export ABC transporter permease LptG n=1 Tax=Coxiella endosymbiont of Dermacentor marginatus TaxID=1656159 RepID=UPI002223B58A|nr:LPS export ABC transporter permease LptG [Coxiella endosymbiont of Dermacentor marginatus]